MSIHKVDSEVVRGDWRHWLETVGKGAQDVVIVVKGRETAALISYADYLALRDALAELRADRGNRLDALATEAGVERLRWEEQLAEDGGDGNGDGGGGGDGGGED